MLKKLSTTRRLGLAVAAVAVVAAITTTGGIAQAAPAPVLTPPTGGLSGLTLSNPSGTSATTFNMSIVPSGDTTCAGDGLAGFRWAGFVTPTSNDPSQLRFDGAGGFPNATLAPGSLPLVTGASTFVVTNTPGSGSGFVNAPSNLSFANTAIYNATNLPAGEYFIGLACYELTTGTATNQFWATPVTITRPGAGPNNLNYTVGLAPASPTFTASGGDATANLNITAPASRTAFGYSVQPPPTPVVSGYSIEAQPVGGGTTVGPFTQATAGAYSFPAGSLTNGTNYDIRVRANNVAGSSSNTTVSPVLVNPPPQSAPTVVVSTAVAEACSIAVSHTATLLPTNYQVNVTTGAAFPGGTPVGASPFTVAAAGGTVAIPGLTAGATYFINVTGTYATPNSGTATVTTCLPTSNRVIVQQVSVVRPPGALILTQRCGVNGSLPADDNTNAFPGFPVNTPAFAALGGTVGVAPQVNAPLAIASGPNPTGAFSAYLAAAQENPTRFAAYPNPPIPASYRTYCGLELGVARLATDGDLAGFYYASGRLNQVTVLDTRDTDDTGWVSNATMQQFTDGVGGGQTFEGNYLGIKPRVNDTSGVDTRGDGVGGTFGVNAADPTLDTAPLSMRGVTAAYTQIVQAGAEVNAGTGVGTAVPGVGDLGGVVLARASAGSALGVAKLDAGIELLIPPSVNAGTYVGELEINLI